MALADTFVRKVKPTGKLAGDKYTDAAGMYLLVKPAGKYWRMDYTHEGKRKTLALGVYPAVSLAEARQKRDAAKKLLAVNHDPLQANRENRVAKSKRAAETFESIARDWLKTTAGKRAAGTQAKLSNWLEHDVFPNIGKMPIATIGPRDVLERVLRKLEARGVNDSAHRIKQLIGQVFRFAVVSGMAERDVTAELAEALEPKQSGHFAAITEPKKAAELLRAIYAYEGAGHPCTVNALKLAPMVFVRPGELRTAEWAELDLDKAEWRIPGAKIKTGNDHIVPLAKQAVEAFRALHPLTGHGKFVFPSRRGGGKPMSENTINVALRVLGFDSSIQSAHGFRAMARTILDEVLGERVDLIEHQLAHAVKDANGRAYNRTAHLPARREMMQRWADYLDQLRAGAQVLSLRGAG